MGAEARAVAVRVDLEAGLKSLQMHMTTCYSAPCGSQEHAGPRVHQRAVRVHSSRAAQDVTQEADAIGCTRGAVIGVCDAVPQRGDDTINA